MWIWQNEYNKLLRDLERRTEECGSLRTAIKYEQAVSVRLEEQLMEERIHTKRERERAERAVDLALQLKFQHQGIQKDPEQVYQDRLEADGDPFAEVDEIKRAQHAHMAKHGAESLLREELSGFSEPDDGFDSVS